MSAKLYFDHAATTPMDEEIAKKIPYLTADYGNADSPHSIGRAAMTAVDRARDRVAALLNAKPSEIYFTSGGTESDNWAIFGGAYAQKKKGRNKIIVSSIEHHAVLSAAERLQAQGVEVVYLPVNEGGRVEINALKKELSDDVGLVAVMAANNETGVLQPIEDLCALAKQNGALFFTDAVQYAPYERVDVKAWNVDMLSLSSHKFYGPKGCGVLYVKEGVRIEKFVAGGEQERGMRGGTLNVPAVVALAAAYEKACATMEENNGKIRSLRDTFVKELSVLEGVTFNGDVKNSIPSVVNVRFSGVDNATLLYKLDLNGVCAAAGSACASASVKPSHVLTAMGLSEQETRSSLRFSFGKNNTEEEILLGAKICMQAVKELRGK